MRNRATVVVLVATAVSPAAAQFSPGEALFEPTVLGSTQYDGWVGLTAGNYPGYGAFPGSAPWPAPIGSNRTPANTFDPGAPGDAVLIKVANGAGGGPAPMGAGIYFGGFSSDPNTFGGTLAVADATPVDNIRNVVFQIQIGEALTWDFFNGTLPVLSYNGGTQSLAPTSDFLFNRFLAGTVQMPTGLEPLYNNAYLLQWDLSAVTVPITEFAISFSAVQHAQVYAMTLHQSDVYTAVPAPSVVSIAGAALMAAHRRRRRGGQLA